MIGFPSNCTNIISFPLCSGRKAFAHWHQITDHCCFSRIRIRWNLEEEDEEEEYVLRNSITYSVEQKNCPLFENSRSLKCCQARWPAIADMSIVENPTSIPRTQRHFFSSTLYYINQRFYDSESESDFRHFSEIFHSNSIFLLYCNRFQVLKLIPKSDIYDSDSDSSKNGNYNTSNINCFCSVKVP